MWSEIAPEDAYLDRFLGAFALEYAIRRGVIDRMADGRGWPDDLPENPLRPMLETARIVEGRRLAPGFAALWATRRTLLCARLDFIVMAARDIALRFDDIAGGRLDRFMPASETFALFRYDKALGTDADSLAATRRWCSYVGALTEAEAPLLLAALDLSASPRILEIGGNTGVLARAILSRHPGHSVTVMDLPAVCAIGSEGPAIPGLSFVAGDARRDPMPPVAGARPDAVLFKSVLHDWQDDDAFDLLSRAAAAIDPGGEIVICERGPFRPGALAFPMVANLVFAPFYRDPDIYRAMLERLGLTIVEHKTIDLDMPFQILRARASA